MFAHLNATTTLSRSISEKGIYPAVDPLDSTSTILKPDILGEEHYETATEVQEVLQRYKELQDIIAILGIDELSDEDKQTVGAGAQDRALPVAAVLRRRAVHRPRGRVRPGRGDRARVPEIVDGKHDDLPERAFYMKGTIDQVLEERRREDEERAGGGRAAEQEAEEEDERASPRRMADDEHKLQAQVLTPEGQVFDGEVDQVSTRTVVGEVGIRANHVAARRPARAAELRLHVSDGEIRRYAQAEGWLRCSRTRRGADRRGDPAGRARRRRR